MRNSRPPRQRGRGRKGPTSNGTNRVFESSGPEGKVRGNSLQIIEKYQALSRDAFLGGDRIVAENFSQHAEHYIRLLEKQKANELARQNANNTRQSNGRNTPEKTDQSPLPAKNTVPNPTLNTLL